MGMGSDTVKRFVFVWFWKGRTSRGWIVIQAKGARVCVFTIFYTLHTVATLCPFYLV